ncbi:hypothetical protein KKD70_02635 [Patescibacteria group bacterium]|nr:hypothetical protein [Patescibacteria group bacterium]
MKYKDRIYEAWQFTQNNKKIIIWYGFLPAFLTTCVGIVYVAYQFLAFKSSPLFDNAEQSFSYTVFTTIINFIKANFSYSVPMLVAAIILLVVYLFIPIILGAAMIEYIARHRNNQKITLGDGITLGLPSFLPLFEYSLAMGTFSIISITTEAGFVLRNLGPNAFNTLLPLFIIILIVALIVHVLFTFAEYYIVIDDEGMMSSIVKSCSLVMRNIQQTFALVVLMMIIGVRIIMQIVLLILVPAIVITGLAYFASISLQEYSLIIIIGLSGVFILFASYLSAVVHVFSVSVWVYTFLDFTEKGYISAREKNDN